MLLKVRLTVQLNVQVKYGGHQGMFVLFLDLDITAVCTSLTRFRHNSKTDILLCE